MSKADKVLLDALQAAPGAAAEGDFVTEAELQRHLATIHGAGSGGDHGVLSGLADDDHTQYGLAGLATASRLTMNTARLLGRATAAVGAVEELTAAQARTVLGLATTDDVLFGSVRAGTIAATVPTRFDAAEAITAHAHYGFIDRSTLTLSGGAGVGHAAFAGYNIILGAGSFDHHNTFQDVTNYAGGGTVARGVSFWAQPIVDSGVITELQGVRVLNAAGSGGTITSQVGVYILPLTRGVTNWAIFTSGATKSYFGGEVDVVGNIYAGWSGSGNRGIYLGTAGYAASLLYNATTGDLDIAPRTGYGVMLSGKLGFFGTSPIAQRAHVADPTGGVTVDAEARTAINAILASIEAFGLHAVS